MKSIRWYSAQLPTSIRSLAAKMKAMPFTKESYDGFVIDRVRDKTLEARYIEKYSYQEKIVDPFGGEQAFERTVYRQIEFTLCSEFPQIEIIDSPRSVRPLINKLAAMSGFSMAISPVSADVLKWASLIGKNTGVKVVVDSLQLAGLELEEGVIAKALIKGDKDVRDAVRLITKNKPYALEKIHLKMSLGNKLVPIFIAHNGTAKYPEDYDTELLPVLRKSLPVDELS